MSLNQILGRVDAACAAASRDRADVTLIAVSKLQPPARVEAVLEAGHRSFGENRVQEAEGKWPGWRERFGGVDLHLIGPLQSNKVRPAMALFDAIHSVDRERLARRIADVAQETGACPDLFVQVNLGREPQKAGIAPEAADALVAAMRGMDLAVAGLTCIPPEGEPPGPHFAALAAIAGRLGIPGLSMGMSADFEEAVAHGATHLRVGAALFGERPG